MTVKESPVEAEGRMVQRELPDPNPPEKTNWTGRPPWPTLIPWAKTQHPEQGTHLPPLEAQMNVPCCLPAGE